jgi:LuxR family maltose regulon positive regulatory protein
VEAWLVSAVASEQLGREATARIALAEAVAAADAAGLSQPLLDAGPSLRALLEANRDLLADRESLGVSGKEPESAGRLVEPITEREADVLRFLPTLLRRNDIARELSVSSNTVKAHVRSLYYKLGVGSRRDAVDRARALGLLR